MPHYTVICGLSGCNICNAHAPCYTVICGLSGCTICNAHVPYYTVLDELSSAHLIIQMLEKESRTEDAPTTLNQQDESYAAGDWEVKLTKRKKGSPGGNKKINITEGTRPQMDTVELRNRFSAFATNREMRLSDNKENKCDNLSRSNTSAPKIHTKQYRRAYIRGLLEKYPTFFLCEHLMDYNLARLHEPTLNLSAHA